jgi:hypothetical protein
MGEARFYYQGNLLKVSGSQYKYGNLLTYHYFVSTYNKYNNSHRHFTNLPLSSYPVVIK